MEIGAGASTAIRGNIPASNLFRIFLYNLDEHENLSTRA